MLQVQVMKSPFGNSKKLYVAIRKFAFLTEVKLFVGKRTCASDKAPCMGEAGSIAAASGNREMRPLA
jgi:hypothetical protein